MSLVVLSHIYCCSHILHLSVTVVHIYLPLTYLMLYLYFNMLIKKLPSLSSHIYYVSTPEITCLCWSRIHLNASPYPPSLLSRISVVELVWCCPCLPSQLYRFSANAIVVITRIICSTYQMIIHITTPFTNVFSVVLCLCHVSVNTVYVISASLLPLYSYYLTSSLPLLLSPMSPPPPLFSCI